nr:hypothetical protein CFP56_57528 [Quercus suber]
MGFGLGIPEVMGSASSDGNGSFLGSSSDHALLEKMRRMMEFSSEINAIYASWAFATLCSEAHLWMVSGVCWGRTFLGGKWGVVVVGLVIAGETIARSRDRGITILSKGVFGGRDGAWALKRDNGRPCGQKNHIRSKWKRCLRIGQVEGGYNKDFGNERSFEIYLDADSSITSSDVVHGSGINLEQLTQLVTNPLKYGVVVKLYRKLKFSFSLPLLRQILSGGDLWHFYGDDLRCFYGRVGATGFSPSSCRRRYSVLDSCRLRELRLRRRQVRNNESIATRRAESTRTEIESSRLGRRTSTLGTWMSLLTLSSLTMVL